MHGRMRITSGGRGGDDVGGYGAPAYALLQKDGEGAGEPGRSRGGSRVPL